MGTDTLQIIRVTISRFGKKGRKKDYSSNSFKNRNRSGFENSGGRKRKKIGSPSTATMTGRASFRHEIMTTRGFCSTSLACAIAWKKKKIARENVQGARLTKLIWSRETRLERSLRNLVWKFNNERRTFEERKLRTLRLSSVRKVKLKKFLFTFSLLRLETVVRVFRTRFPTCSFARGPRDRMANA